MLGIIETMDSPLNSPAQLLLKLIVLVSSIVIMVYSKAEQQRGFVSDVIGVEEKMLNTEYWTNKIATDEAELLTAEQIAAENKKLFAENRFMAELANYPQSLSAKEISEKILTISSAPAIQRFYSDGQEVSKANYEVYHQTLNLAAIPEQQSVKFGMIVRRTDMRTFPTEDRVYNTTSDHYLDRFQESALFPTEAVAILHESLDKQWLFVISYNYAAWVKKADVAIGNADQIFAYKKADNFLVVTANKLQTAFNPDNQNISELQLEMGTVIPLVDDANIPTTVAGQNTYASYVVSLPVREADGKLVFKMALISRTEDVHLGFLPYTKKNIIIQAFKFLGERYGWGHSFNARDCTGFVGEVYKSFGILMPRNSGQQGQSEQGGNTRFLKTATRNEKLALLKNLSVGDLIYIPGHVMMVLGFDDDKPFIIHDVSGLSYFKDDGEFYKSKLNGVSITPLIPMQLSQQKSYVDEIYNIKKIK